MQNVDISNDVRSFLGRQRDPAASAAWPAADMAAAPSTLPMERPSALHLLALRRWKQRRFEETEVNWGIRLRPGYCDSSNPAAHRGTVQHAYVLGHDATALCGFRSGAGGAGRKRKVARLGLPSAEHNPRCVRCAPMVLPIAEPGAAPLTW